MEYTFAKGNMESDLKSELNGAIENQIDYLFDLYRHLHAHPELSGLEVETGARMASELEAMGCKVFSQIGGHGVAAVLENGPGPCVLIRADMGRPAPCGNHGIAICLQGSGEQRRTGADGGDARLRP